VTLDTDGNKMKLHPEVISNPPPLRPAYTVASAFLAVGLILATAILIALDVGCATAAPFGAGDGPADAGNALQDDAVTADAGAHVDAPIQADAARPLDAAEPTTVTLTQTSTASLAASSLGCQNGNSTASEAYYRVFDLAALGIATPLTVSSVTFGVQQAAGAQTVDARIGMYSAAPGDTLSTGSTDWAGGDVTALGSAAVAIPATDTGETVTTQVTATVPGGAYLIVEIFSPSHSSSSDTYFFLGASNGTDTTPGFFWAPSCGASPAGTPAELGESPVPFQIEVTGSY
jgi:hypothetical protein